MGGREGEGLGNERKWNRKQDLAPRLTPAKGGARWEGSREVRAIASSPSCSSSHYSAASRAQRAVNLRDGIKGYESRTEGGPKKEEETYLARSTPHFHPTSGPIPRSLAHRVAEGSDIVFCGTRGIGKKRWLGIYESRALGAAGGGGREELAVARVQEEALHSIALRLRTSVASSHSLKRALDGGLERDCSHHPPERQTFWLVPTPTSPPRRRKQREKRQTDILPVPLHPTPYTSPEDTHAESLEVNDTWALGPLLAYGSTRQASGLFIFIETWTILSPIIELSPKKDPQSLRVLRLLEHSMHSFNPKEVFQSLRMLRLLEHLILPFALILNCISALPRLLPKFFGPVHPAVHDLPEAESTWFNIVAGTLEYRSKTGLAADYFSNQALHQAARRQRPSPWVALCRGAETDPAYMTSAETLPGLPILYFSTSKSPNISSSATLGDEILTPEELGRGRRSLPTPGSAEIGVNLPKVDHRFCHNHANKFRIYLEMVPKVEANIPTSWHMFNASMAFPAKTKQTFWKRDASWMITDCAVHMVLRREFSEAQLDENIVPIKVKIETRAQ
ncbi:hypothetical protein B0H13DRAFT_1907712 [Mycena leptocephala]|nr:hypothetical protein B0H13DRAFT_1907712 [Mycena leptocephala]